MVAEVGVLGEEEEEEEEAVRDVLVGGVGVGALDVLTSGTTFSRGI